MTNHKISKEKKDHRPKADKQESSMSKKGGNSNSLKNKTSSGTFSLLAGEQAVDPSLSSLFAAQPTPPTRPKQRIPAAVDEAVDNDAELSELDSSGAEDGAEEASDVSGVADVHVEVDATAEDGEAKASKRKRKRNAEGDDLEDAYMRRLAREEAKESEVAAAERAAKRQKANKDKELGNDEEKEEEGSSDQGENEESDEGEIERTNSPPPKHETEQAADDDFAKASRTVFLSNVSTTAISSKSSRKTLMNHLQSFFSTDTKPAEDGTKPAVESIRFRSTPYASSIPKKAAYAKKELMDATTKSTNAYAVYSTQALAREAAKKLNGTMVLDRHLRVDNVAHPAKVDHKRCIFVGNLGFVDDESNINAANAEDGRETRKPGKVPADVEEGLWRVFGKCGAVESVRVIRDSTTRVGKGIAYVQFQDENAVESALLNNEKKFPPMLPRKLRVSRAKAQKRNAKPGSGRPASKPAAVGYQRKITGEEASKMGRAGKLLGRAAAAQLRRPGKPNAPNEKLTQNGDIMKPESFVFEGHRASSKSGKAGLKLGGKGKKKVAKPTNRSAKRAAAYKAGKK